VTLPWVLMFVNSINVIDVIVASVGAAPGIISAEFSKNQVPIQDWYWYIHYAWFSSI
jgi:hypothetical protein